MKLNKKTIPSIISFTILILPIISLLLSLFIYEIDSLFIQSSFVENLALFFEDICVYSIVFCFPIIGCVLCIIFGIIFRKQKLCRLLACLSIVIFIILMIYVINISDFIHPIWMESIIIGGYYA